MVLGSRYVAGGRIVDWSWHREVFSRGGNRYTRMRLGVRLREITAGPGLSVQRSAPARVGHGRIRRVLLSGGPGLASCPRRPASGRGAHHLVKRTEGASKMSGAIVREALWQDPVGMADR